MKPLTFNEAPYGDLASRHQRACDAGIYGVPMDMLATTAGGQRGGTEAIRACSYGDHDPVTGRSWSDYRVIDFGDLDVIPGNYPGTTNRQVSQLTRILHLANRAYVLGGDDSINVANAQALRRWATDKARVVMVHLDAHHDTNGRAGELPDHSTWVADVVEHDVDEVPWVNEVIQVGVRAPGIKDPQVRHTRALDVDSAIRCVRELPPAVVVWLAIDLDVLDPAYAPGVAVPEPFGMTPSDLHRVVAAIGPRAKLTSVTELTPSNDVNGITALIAHRLVMRAIMSTPAVAWAKTPGQRSGERALMSVT